MINKLKDLPHRVLFIIGFSLIVISSLLAFTNFWLTIISGILVFVAILFVLLASDKRNKNKN